MIFSSFAKRTATRHKQDFSTNFFMQRLCVVFTSHQNNIIQNKRSRDNLMLGLLLAACALFQGASFHQYHPTTARAKDATSASKKNYSSSADLNYHHSISAMNSCPHAATETKRYCVTSEQSI